MFIEERLKGIRAWRGPNEPPTKETVFTAEDPYLDFALKTHIEPFNILIVSAGENL